ncbi:type II secretion system secretin GspD [Methylobacter sp.]|uniref:type II secretion system secretin GspD n=1 Tax=Methylobacter sp. TaxID=2051955 RepID=UPI002487C8C8|nr:type II secretion system secretin GspD [Methylobacter sp.]MDI1276671.1 type II secretion system secretin GspD [Methylobacter sp.]MDI1357340.1 type II secretion system secretin GspD [Methylobacter sp.]
MINIKKVTTTSCLVVLGLTLSSCESLGPQPMAKLPLTPVRKEQTDVSIDQLKNKAPATAVTRAKPELFPGTNRFVPETATQHRTTKSRGEGAYSLNFDEADLGEVAKVILSDILGQNYVLSPKVAGKVTLQTTDPLSKEELIPTLEMLLRMNNAVLIKDARIYHIEPASEALYSSSFAAPNTGGRTGFQVRVIPIKNVAVQAIVDVIKPLVQEKTILNVDSTRNILIASGTPNELGRVMDMVSVFDVDVLKGQSFGLFPLAHVEPETIIKELEEIFRKEGKEGESNFFRFIPVERLNAVMAITHQAGYLKDIENWIFRLDRANTASGGGVNVYRVQNVDAEELAATLNEIFTGAAKKEKSAKVAPGEKAAELTNKAPEKQNVPKTSTPTGEAEVANVGEVRIISDVANNSVIVVATPQEYEVILPVIKQLDLLPLQVLIDATIVSVKLTDSLKYGIQWFLDHGGSSISSGNGAATLGSIATASAAAFTSGGLTAIYNSGVVNALLSAQANKGNVNIISSPSLMVLNNQEAKINVGDQVPIQTGTLGSVVGSGGTTGATTAIQSSIQYKDTGVTLEVTPRVNANGMVIMEIKQTVSSAVKTETGVNTSPTIQKKEIESSVAVQDSETIVLGGLIDNNNSNAIGGIPWLNELPWIGPLFGNTDRENIKNELVVLITPRVVKSKQDSRLISDEFKRKLTGIYEYKATVPGSPAVE